MFPARVRLRWAVVIALCMAMAVPAFAAYPMKVKDARGKMITIKAKPMRIVSITPSNTEMLFALGLGDRVVGVTGYCNYPSEAKKKPKIGDMQISAEAVVALKPDLVLGHAHMNDAAAVQLENLGLTVFTVNPKTIDQVMSDLVTVGKIAGRPKTAEGVVQKMKRSIASVKASMAKKTPRKALVVIQPNPLWAAGPKTFLNEMISITRAKNVAFDARPGFVTFSKEVAISRNPDLIVVGIKGDADYFLKSPEWRNTNAVKNKRVIVIDSDITTRPGPRLADGLKALAKAISY